jgi:RimJ/RimL family protein N-acetyltransferase
MFVLTGSMIFLRPATETDRKVIFQWLTLSDLTSSMLGPPVFMDAPIPSWEQFVEDYEDHYFNDSDPEAGRSFIIQKGALSIGHISYNDIHEDRSTELDIWMASSAFTGKGFGTKAIQVLCTHLHSALGCMTFYMAPSMRNKNAIRSYMKAGFEETSDVPLWFVPDYYDTILLRKEIPLNQT